MRKKLNSKSHYTTKEAAAALKVSTAFINRLCNEGKLPRSYRYCGNQGRGLRFRWAVDKNSLQKYKLERNAYKHRTYNGTLFPHLRYVKYCILWEGFSYELAKKKARKLGLPYLNEDDHAAMCTLIMRIVKDYDEKLEKSLRYGIKENNSFSNPAWGSIFKQLEIEEIFENPDKIPWCILKDDIAHWTLDCCFLHLVSNAEIVQLMLEKFGYEISLPQVAMYKDYFCDFNPMTDLDVKVYMSHLNPREKRFKEDMKNISSDIFRHKVGIDLNYDQAKVLDGLAKRAEEMAHRAAASIGKDDVDAEKSVKLMKDYAKAIKDYRGLSWDAEDRSGGIKGARNAAEAAIKLKFEIEQDKKAIPLDQLEGKIMSSKPKEKTGDGESAS